MRGTPCLTTLNLVEDQDARNTPPRVRKEVTDCSLALPEVPFEQFWALYRHSSDREGSRQAVREHRFSAPGGPCEQDAPDWRDPKPLE